MPGWPENRAYNAIKRVKKKTHPHPKPTVCNSTAKKDILFPGWGLGFDLPPVAVNKKVAAAQQGGEAKNFPN